MYAMHFYTWKPSTHTGRYVLSSPNVASLAFPCSMGVIYRRPHELQYTHNSKALNTHWALRIAVPMSLNATYDN